VILNFLSLLAFLVLLVDGSLRLQLVLVLHREDDVVGDCLRRSEWGNVYNSFFWRIYYWSIMLRFLANSCLTRRRTAYVLTGLSTILLASLRQSLKMVRVDLFSIN
jgi:hypothetical protein